jgi:DNA-binding NarL/FixJ family response regulator
MDDDSDRNGTIRVLIVENNKVFLRGLASLLEYEEDIDVCGITDSSSGAMKLIGEKRPDLLIVDISLGVDNGIDLVRDLTAQQPKLPVIVLSMHDEYLFAKRALRAGARGYLSKQEAPETIVRAIRSVLSGGEFLSEAMSHRTW